MIYIDLFSLTSDELRTGVAVNVKCQDVCLSCVLNVIQSPGLVGVGPCLKPPPVSDCPVLPSLYDHICV